MGSARDLPGKSLSPLRFVALHLLERWGRSALPLRASQIEMPEDLVPYNPLRGHTMTVHKKEQVMLSPTGVQARTFSWLPDGIREFLSFQRTPSGDRDKPVSVSDTTQPILESGLTATLLRMKEKKETGAPISQEEWALLARYVQWGAESPPKRHHPRESVVGILQAFRAAYKLRRP